MLQSLEVKSCQNSFSSSPNGLVFDAVQAGVSKSVGFQRGNGVGRSHSVIILSPAANPELLRRIRLGPGDESFPRTPTPNHAVKFMAIANC